MSASQLPAQTAVAFQFAAALENYERDLRAMVVPGFNPEVCARIAQQMDQMRLYATSLPKLSVPWVEVLIRHFELTHALWQHQRGQLEWKRVSLLHVDQQGAVERLHKQCVRLIAREAPSA